MSKLDTQIYVLEEQRALSPEQRLRWHYHIPTYGESQVCTRLSSAVEDKKESAQLFALHRLGCSLDSVQNWPDRRAPLPPAEDLEARLAWTQGLPFPWVVELFGVIEKESTLDPEEE